MLFLRMKSVVALNALVLASSTLIFVSSSFANSVFVPKHTSLEQIVPEQIAPEQIAPKQKTIKSQELIPTAAGFIYPAPTLIDSDFIETGVLFVYNNHILDYFNGDSEKLLNYVNDNIAHNNQAFVNSNIPIKRVVSGLLYVESNDIWSSNDSYTDRLHALASWQRTTAGEKLKQQHQNSYLVSLAGFQTSIGEITMLGQAFVGDNVSWISPFNTDADLWLERTLAHELSHNDGFKHANTGHQDDGDHIARFDAAGYQCGSHGSIMYVSGERTEPFFSDAEIRREEKEQVIECGAIGEANAAQVYRDLLKTMFAKKERTFRNIQQTRSKTGVVSIHQNVSAALEGNNIQFDVIFEGADAGDSVNFVARQGTAGLGDFVSTVGSVVHDGINNVYTISMPTRTDNTDEAVEVFSYELVYPNGVTIDSASASIDVSIFDKNDDVGYIEFSANISLATQKDNIQISPSSVSSSELATSSSNAPIVASNNTSFASTNADIGQASGGSITIFWTFLLMLAFMVRRPPHK